MRGAIASLLTLGLSVSTALAGGPATGKIVLDLWDVAYLQGGRAGYVHTFTEEINKNGQKLLRTTMELRLTIKRFEETIQLGMDTGTLETPAGKVAGVFMRQYLGKNKALDIVGTVMGKQLHLVRDGQEMLKPAPWNDEVIGLYRQQSMFKDRQVKPGDKFSYPSFEPSINLVLTTNVEVKDFENLQLFVGGPRQKVLRVESRPERIEKVTLPSLITWLDEERQQVRADVDVPGLGVIQMVRTTKAKALNTSGPVARTDIGLSQLVRLKQPIVRPYDTTMAVYRITLKDDEDPASAFAQDDRQQVKNLRGNTFELHVRASEGPVGKGEERLPGAEFLQSSYFINSDDPQVRELARRAIAAEKDPWHKALRVERWVHDHMTVKNHEALATADHVARTLEGDCTEFAMLTAAMCRAAGVPSRTAVGLIYADLKGNPSFAFHMWTEVWARGQWLPLDATLGRGHVAATHLKISAQSWHDTRTMTPLFPVVRVLGRVAIEVVGVEGR
jgi:transglutaminase-like putative cysteine protease